jgi:hypothetical protein
MKRLTSRSRGRVLAAVAIATLANSASGAESAGPGYFRMKLVKVVDRRGFEKPLTAVTLLVPTDWSFQGDVKYDPRNACTATLAEVTFRAASPDGRTAVELFPMAAWNWSDDPMTRQFMERDLQTRAQYGTRGCPIGPPLPAQDYVTRYVVGRARPGSRVTGTEADADAASLAAQLVRQAEAESAKVGLPTQIRADTVRVRVEYERQGQPEEEWFTAITFARGTPMPTFNTMTGQMGQAMSYACGAEYVFGAAAPKGKLASSEKLFRAIVGSVRVAPEWQARVQQAQLNIHAIELKGAADRSRIIAKSAEDTSRIIDETYQRRQASQDRIGEQWSQVRRGVETYRNPGTGETVELSNQYGNAWSNGKNEYLLSDSPGFDPNTVSRENWTRLERAQPGR